MQMDYYKSLINICKLLFDRALGFFHPKKYPNS